MNCIFNTEFHNNFKNKIAEYACLQHIVYCDDTMITTFSTKYVSKPNIPYIVLTFAKHITRKY